MSTQFIHLHLHTEFSISDGISRIPAVCQRAVDFEMPAVAITDLSNLFAMVKLYRVAMSCGIKPIVGADLWIENVEESSEPFRLVLLCQNNQGYQNVTKLISRAYLENQQLDKPIIKREWLTPESCEGLIALSAGLDGDIGRAISKGKKAVFKKRLQAWLTLFPERFYLELQRVGHEKEEPYINEALNLAEEFNVPVVATNFVCFVNPDDFEAHEARTCVSGGWVLNDPKRPHDFTDQQYFRSPAEMIELFNDIPEAIENTMEIAKRCTITLSLGKNYLPNFPVPEGMTVGDFLEHESREGLEERLAILYDITAEDFAEIRKPYDERLNYELGIINQMGFPGYFLIVADFIRWSKNNGVPVGPGRGSGAGSLVAYSLKITDLDPLEDDLLFERFLNPERISMPDFDVDFCMDGRDRVIDYVAQKYGRESVSQIITYGSMAAKAVIRDVGRVLGHGYGFVDKIAKLIPFEIGITLGKALDQEEALMDRYEQEEEVRNLIDLAKKLEGITRNVGKHAGGLVISPSLLTDFTPLYCESDGSNLVTQFDKEDVEAVGLVKFDFLGLRTLTIIDWAVQAINKRLKIENKEPIDITLIPTNDGKSFALLKACKTTAVFQLESRGMKDLIKRLQPDCFEDIIALVALFRPGPLQSGMVDDFIDRKHGRAKVEYPDDRLAPVLQETYGVILYQEQVMQIAQVLAGYSLGAADLLRKAMGKKKPEVMAKQRAIFMKGALENNLDESKATYIFDLMEKFAGYGFNKSHSAAYALIAYQTAWLKAHYPAEFMAAVLSSDMDNTDKVVNFSDECHQMKLEVLPPDINRSHFQFVVEEGKVVYGLGAIKGVGQAAIECIEKSREEEGAFKDLFDFCTRVDMRKANKRVLEALIKSGALDSFGVHRAALLSTLLEIMQAAEQNLRNKERGQNDLFGEAEDQPTHYEPNYDVIKPFSEQERLNGEKETLGLYVTGHPLAQYENELNHIATNCIAKLSPSKDQTIMLAGLISGIRIMNTKRGDRMAFVTVSDRTGKIDVTVFSDVYEEYFDLLEKDKLLIAEGEVSVDEYSGGFRVSAKSLMSIDQAREKFAKHILIHLNEKNCEKDFVEKLGFVLKPFRGWSCPVCIAYQQAGAKALLPLGKEWRVIPSDDLLERLREYFPDCTVEMVYR